MRCEENLRGEFTHKPAVLNNFPFCGSLHNLLVEIQGATVLVRAVTKEL